MYIFTRFGSCEPYTGGIEACNDVFTAGVDYVFIAAHWASENETSMTLEQAIPKQLKLISHSDASFCYDQLNTLICKYYLSPCGTESSQILPRSICSEDCYAVQRDCPTAWDAVQQGFDNFINCNDTSALFFPLPNCCTGVGSRNTEGDASKQHHYCIYVPILCSQMWQML